MNTTAIQQAIRLYKHPSEMQWLSFPDTLLPDGVTDLLRLSASREQLDLFVKKLQIDKEVFTKILNNFIEKVILNEKNSDEKKLGLLKEDNSEKRKLHYQLLMKIYHPDRNTSSNAATIASDITKTYQSLKNQEFVVNANSVVKHKSAVTRTPPKSFYRATIKAEQQISRTKNAFIAIASLSALALFTFAFNVYQPDKPQLVLKKTENSFKTVSNESLNQNTLNNTSQFTNEIKLAKLDVPTLNNVPKSQLQQLLHKLESAYETGDVNQIKPILENAPEIKNQSADEINAKLETLFKITSERKMLVFNVDWNVVSGQFLGQGKFLSRYLLRGEEQWLTREGKAYITASLNDNNELKITGLKLENNTNEY